MWFGVSPHSRWGIHLASNANSPTKRSDMSAAFCCSASDHCHGRFWRPRWPPSCRRHRDPSFSQVLFKEVPCRKAEVWTRVAASQGFNTYSEYFQDKGLKRLWKEPFPGPAFTLPTRESSLNSPLNPVCCKQPWHSLLYYFACLF